MQRAAIARSMTHPCQEVAGEHPGDGSGGRVDWKQTASGGWQRPGACTLPGPGLREARAEARYEELFDEQIGPITWAMSAETEARALLGKPQRGRREKLPAVSDDAFSELWKYPRQGLELRVIGPGELSVLGVHIEAPSQLKTRKGVHIGSTRADVRAAYGDMLDPAKVKDDDATWTVGYDRMLGFEFVGDEVVGISLIGSWD
jgi:hypothetical protein